MHSIKASLVAFFVAYLAIAAPLPDTTNQVDNAYSGIGGHAVGGSVTHNTISGTRLLGSTALLKLFADNAGNGGRANSGSAAAKTPANVRVGTSSRNTEGSTTTNSAGNSFSGAAGASDGGSVEGESDALISLFSGNAGNGGGANSGIAGSLVPVRRPRVPTRVSRGMKLTLD